MNRPTDQPTCKACGEVMKTVHHWRHVYIGTNAETGKVYFVTKEWDRSLTHVPDIACCCGDLCNLVLLERWLDTGTLEAPGCREQDFGLGGNSQ